LQQRTSPIAASLHLQEHFDPWITNCHVQTIGGFLLRQDRRSSSAAYVRKNNSQKAMQQVMLAIVAQTQVSAEAEETTTSFWDHREKITTPDGDWFHADTKYANSNNITAAPTVILLHGFNSNSESGVSMDIARAYVAAGMNCVCLNFRGCSGPPNDTLRFYHLGFTEDIKHSLQLLKKRNTNNDNNNKSSSPKIYLSGLSLGANVALRVRSCPIVCSIG
jgi:predicted alpha/beta-fold hydrolase